MGLDNGIVLKTKMNITESNIPSYVCVEDISKYLETDKIRGYEICHWRNCYGIRNEIINVCSNIKSDGKSELNEYDIELIRDMLIDYLKNPESWDDKARSIWELDIMIDQIAQQVVNLSWLMQFMSDKSNQHWTVEFYDSY